MNNENKNINNKIYKLHNKSKTSKETKNDIMTEIQPKLKILSKYFKLEELKQQEKVSQFQEGFIDPTIKPKFFFMRSELKTKNREFRPTTNLCTSKRNKTYSTLFKKSIVINGFRNYSGRKIETEIIPNNFDDIQSLIELKETKNNIMMNKFLLNDKKYYKIKDIGNKIKKKLNTKLLKNIDKKTIKLRNKNEGFTKSIIIKNYTNYNLNIDNNKIKRPFTSKDNKKISTDLFNEKKNGQKIYNAKRMIKSAITQRPKKSQTQREYNININNQNIRYPNKKRSNKNISCYTTTFKSYSKSLSKNSRSNNLFKNIEKQVLNPDSFFMTRANNQVEKNEFKSTKQIIQRILNDCNIIDKYIKNKEEGIDHSFHKNDKEEILLRLADRLKKNKIKKLKIGIKGKKTRVILEDEKAFEKKLEKIPRVAKQFFRDVYKQILFEKRILNKAEKKNIIDAIEEKQTKKKFYSEIKKEVKEKMILTKANLITDKDDKVLLDEQRKLFDFYGSLDGLEWLIMKKHIMNFGTNLITGKVKKRVNNENEHE